MKKNVMGDVNGWGGDILGAARCRFCRSLSRRIEISSGSKHFLKKLSENLWFH